MAEFGIYIIMQYFRWDSVKASTNLNKHGVSFSEAATIFFDALVMLAPDPHHSAQEDRQLAIGKPESKRVLLVSFT
jgi:uncharacterized DUF497 family protein